MRDPRYEEPYKLAGVTRALDSVGVFLNEFVWEIEEAVVKEVTAFGEGKARIVFVPVSESSPAAGRTIAEVTQDRDFPADCVIVGLYRPQTGEFIIRRGHVTLLAGDRVYLAANTQDIQRATKCLGVK